MGTYFNLVVSSMHDTKWTKKLLSRFLSSQIHDGSWMPMLTPKKLPKRLCNINMLSKLNQSCFFFNFLTNLDTWTWCTQVRAVRSAHWRHGHAGPEDGEGLQDSHSQGIVHIFMHALPKGALVSHSWG